MKKKVYLPVNMFACKIKNFFHISKRTFAMDRYVWVDLEMTGLDAAKDTILEIACIISTPNLDINHEGINIVIHQPDEVLKSMNDWCLKQHSKTGLIEASKKSKISLTEAEQKVADYIKQYTSPTSVRYIAGNSVYMDKIFLDKHMPCVSSLLHYRLIDVSVIKTLSSHWYPDDFNVLRKKKLVHRSLDDIKESIEELRRYREKIFK